MGLQMSLYGHQGVITDIDISKCNRYIASASQEGVIMIWDLLKCSLIEKIEVHNAVVNNLKFFEFKIKKDSHSGKTQSETI
jgi:WD40 repeat protein